MNFLRKMERKFGKYAIRHLTLYIIGAYVIGYILELVGMNGSYLSILYYLTLDPGKILRGQIWRLFSWLLIPPSGLSIFTFIMLVFYYQLGTALERTWGDFIYNVYIFFGLIMTVIGAFILYLIPGMNNSVIWLSYSTYYVSLSIFLGLAMTYPEMKVLLFFVIPIKVKYMAYFDIAYLIYTVIEAFRTHFIFGMPVLFMIVTSLAAPIVFFFMMQSDKKGSFEERRRRKEFQQKMNMGRQMRDGWPYPGAGKESRRGQGPYSGGMQGNPGQNGGNGRFDGYTYGNGQTGPAAGGDHHVYGSNGSPASNGAYGNDKRQAGSIPGGFGYRLPDGRIAKHRCAVCGRTELDDPNLEFRFCSKCNGNYEYCQDHLFTHEHVK